MFSKFPYLSFPLVLLLIYINHNFFWKIWFSSFAVAVDAFQQLGQYIALIIQS